MSYAPLTLSTIQKISYQTSPKNAAGNPIGLDGPIQFSVDIAGIAAVAGHDSNNYTGEIDGTKAGGPITVTASATSQGIPLSETFQVMVTPDSATTFGFTFSAAALR